MTLTLYFHPLASFAQKVLIALYENGTPFTPRLVDLAKEDDRAEFEALWPMRKMPVLKDEARGRTIPESTSIIEYLALHYPGRVTLVPADPDAALQVRLMDRLYDSYIQLPMQKIVLDRLRPEGNHDRHGVAEARAQLATALSVIERDMEGRIWAMGEDFTMADCAAAPALFYASEVAPFGATYPAVAAYFERLEQRPSFARVLKEAQPYRHLFPLS